jgi:Spy/CpxP family protein refolding chaperone
MKRQIIALVAGAALIAAPLMTNIASADMPGGGRSGKMERLTQNLELTESQQTQLKQIHARTKAKMEAVFTPEQRQEIATAQAERQQNRQAYKENGGQQPNGAKRTAGRRGGMKNVNLTEAQKAELKRIHQEAKVEEEAVLTNTQKAKIAEARQQRQLNRQQRSQQWQKNG